MAAETDANPSYRAAVSFPGWKEALTASGEPPDRQQDFSREIITFLRRCKLARCPASVELAKQYLAAIPEQDANLAREALRWFFRAARASGPLRGAATPPITAAGRSNSAPRPNRSTPLPAAQDRGANSWEHALIQAMRRRNFLWRTEETYRRWAARFAQFIAPRSPYAVGGVEVGAFLNRIALEQRASASTQRQALNALVFFMQEALSRDLGELHYRRAEKPVRLPAVLTREECRRLFVQLDGTAKLMAELM